MNSLWVKDNLFQDLFDFRRSFDDIFNRFMTKPFLPEVPWKEFEFVPPAETFVDTVNKKYVCRVQLPGVESANIQIHVQGNLLTIHGTREYKYEKKEIELYEKEFAYGKFQRVLTLPEGVTTDKLVASYLNGVLEITAPMSVAALPRKVEIKTVPLTKQIAA